MTVSDEEIRISDNNFGYKEFRGPGAAERAEAWIRLRYPENSRIERITQAEALRRDGYAS